MIIGIDASRANQEQRTGVENYAYFVIQALQKELGDEEVRLYIREHINDSWGGFPELWSVKRLFMPFGRLWTQLRLSWEMIWHAPDVLFVPAHVVPLILPKRTVVMIHDVAPLRFPKSYNWFERWYGVWSTRFALKHCETVVVPSEFTRQELVELFEEAAGANIVVVPEAYDTKRFHGAVSSDEVKKKYSLVSPYVLFIGRLEEKKDVVRLVHAFERLRRRKKIQLVLGGKPGYGYEKIAEAITNSPWKKDIIELGYVPDSDLPGLYADAAVFSFATQYEGFGIPVLEALAVGTPVVVSKGGAAAEVGAGAVVQIGEGVDALVTGLEQAMTERNVQKGFDRTAEFSWESAAQQLATLIKR